MADANGNGSNYNKLVWGIIGGLMVVAGATSRIVYSNLDTRVSNVEAHEPVQDEKITKLETIVPEVRDTLKENNLQLKEVNKRLDRIEARQSPRSRFE